MFLLSCRKRRVLIKCGRSFAPALSTTLLPRRVSECCVVVFFFTYEHVSCKFDAFTVDTLICKLRDTPAARLSCEHQQQIVVVLASTKRMISTRYDTFIILDTKVLCCYDMHSEC